MRRMYWAFIFIMLMSYAGAQWVRPTASGSAAGGVFTWFGAFNVSDNVTSPVYCIGTYCIDTWPNMTIPGSYLNSSNLTFIRETINNSGEYNIFINYSNLLNAPSYTNMTDTRWNISGSRYLYNSSANGNLMFNDTVADNYTWSTDGLVFYAPFNGDALDYSGYGRDGYIINTTQVQIIPYSKYGSGLKIIGTNGGVDAPVNIPAGNITINFWINPSIASTGDGNYHFFFDSFNGRYLMLQNSNTTFTFFAGTNPIGDITNITYSANTWQMFTFINILETDTTSFYQNGNKIFEQTLADSRSTITNISIGKRYVQSTTTHYSMPGLYDDFRIWNRSLSSNEVMGLYKMKSEVYPANSVRNVANLSIGRLYATNISVSNTKTNANYPIHVFTNVSNISIYSVGYIWSDSNISGVAIIDRSAYPEEGLVNTLSTRSNGAGEVDYATVSPFVKSIFPKPIYKTIITTSKENMCVTNELTQQDTCTLQDVPKETQVIDKIEQIPGRNLGAAIAETEVAIQELYAENCAQMQVFIDKGLLKPEDIKMKHCDLVTP